MSPDRYDFWTAIGTVGAVAVALSVAIVQATVALTLSIRRRSLARRKVASLVSAWVEHEYIPSASGEFYRRRVSLHLANESDEPVFKVEVLCGVSTGNGTVQLGPLAAPRVIPTLPPKREFVYDVTMGMLGFGEFAHDAFHGLVAEVAFRDHEEKRWERRFDGGLYKIKKPRAARIVQAGDELAVAQAGPPDNPYNPLGVVFAFANAASDVSISDKRFRELLAAHASGWSEIDHKKLAEVRELLRTANVATHVWYPTPRIGYVRLLEHVQEESAPHRAQILTLVWRNGRGWTLFGLGPYLPWDIGFASGELEVDPLEGREHQ